MAADAFDQTPDEPDQSVEEAPNEAPEVEESGTSEGFEAPFNINEIEDEAVRDYVEKYNRQLQGAFTQKTQQMATQRQEWESSHDNWTKLNNDPDFQQQLFRELAELQGYELEEEDAEGYDPEDDDSDEEMFHDPRFTQFQTELEQVQAQQEEQARVEHIIGFADNALSEYEQKVGELTDEEKGVIVNTAVQMPLVNDLPDIAGAITQYEAVANSIKQQYIASKKAPTIARGGTEGVQEIDLDDPEQRTAWMQAQLDGGPTT